MRRGRRGGGRMMAGLPDKRLSDGEGQAQGGLWSAPWRGEAAGEAAVDGDGHAGQRASLWEAELTALWEAEAAGRFTGFGRATEEEEAWSTDLNR
jgi:hypothetical protein